MHFPSTLVWDKFAHAHFQYYDSLGRADDASVDGKRLAKIWKMYILDMFR